MLRAFCNACAFCAAGCFLLLQRSAQRLVGRNPIHHVIASNAETASSAAPEAVTPPPLNIPVAPLVSALSKS